MFFFFCLEGVRWLWFISGWGASSSPSPTRMPALWAASTGCKVREAWITTTLFLGFLRAEKAAAAAAIFCGRFHLRTDLGQPPYISTSNPHPTPPHVAWIWRRALLYTNHQSMSLVRSWRSWLRGPAGLWSPVPAGGGPVNDPSGIPGQWGRGLFGGGPCGWLRLDFHF